MDLINITINGRAVQAQPGQSVLEAAAAAGIEIPTLCHHPRLRATGSCRVCVVEIEKQRTLQPACTFPVTPNMVVQTESEKVVAARIFALQMLFSERPHYCMFCVMSGSESNTDCELQKLAYRYKLDHWTYPPDTARSWPVDASRAHFIMDHSRCILCRRCVQACAQVAANHTLGVYARGARSMIGADDDVPFGESTCISCGTCLQVCPTGALMDRRSAYRGRETQVQRTKATCLGCAVGCGIEAMTRDNQLIRIEGDWDASNAGLLCERGRFAVLAPTAPRLTTPLVRRGGAMVETSLDEALDLVAQRLTAAERVAGLISPRMTNRLLAGFTYIFNEALQSEDVGLLYGEVPPRDLGQAATLADVAQADAFVVLGVDPLKDHKVVGQLVRRAVDQGAHLIVVDDLPNGLDSCAELRLPLRDIPHEPTSPFARLRQTYHLQRDGLARVRAALELARRPVVIHGAGLSALLCAALRALPEQVRFLPLVQGSNTFGATRLGLQVRPVSGDVLYVMAGDDFVEGVALPQAPFTVVQAAYPSAWTAAADVVLPARTWCEKPGHIVNIEGRRLASVPLLQPPPGVQADLQTLFMLATRLGHGVPYDEISEICEAI